MKQCHVLHPLLERFCSSAKKNYSESWVEESTNDCAITWKSNQVKGLLNFHWVYFDDCVGMILANTNETNSFVTTEILETQILT